MIQSAQTTYESELSAWMYVSRSCLQRDRALALMAELVSFSVARNAELQVTGALIFTSAHFAQLIEGPPSTITTLRNAIAADFRHDELSTVQPPVSRVRRFASWSLAYSGPSHFIAAAVERALGTEREVDGEDLFMLLCNLAQ